MTSKIEGVFIQQDEDNYAPPGMDVLYVTSVGDTIYLEIGEYEETAEKRTFIYKATVAVPFDQLVYALELLRKAEGKLDNSGSVE